jgi:hypothetical protein
MRVLRVMGGMLTLLLAAPVLGAGVAAWWGMQHRSPDGAFHATLEPFEAPGEVVVIPDLDALLRRHAPFARAGQTTMSLTARHGAAPVFIGLARPGEVAGYLAGSTYTQLDEARLGRGQLPVRTSSFDGTGTAPADPAQQRFWLQHGTEGTLTWNPSAYRGQRLSLVIIAPPVIGPDAATVAPAPDPSAGTDPSQPGSDPLTPDPLIPAPAGSDPNQSAAPVNELAPAEPMLVEVALNAGWLTSTTWGLLVLGPVLLLLGFAALAWPQRPREIVYVVEPGIAGQLGLPGPRQEAGQLAALPEAGLMARARAAAALISAGAPTMFGGGGHLGGQRTGPDALAARPADSSSRPPAGLEWPLMVSGPPPTEPARDVHTQEIPRILPEAGRPHLDLRLDRNRSPH